MAKLKDMPLGSLVTWSKLYVDNKWVPDPTNTGLVIGHHKAFGDSSWHIVHWLKEGYREDYISREDLKYVLKVKGRK